MLIFNFLSEMKAMYEPDLRVMLGRLTGHTPSESAVRQTAIRWQKAGLARAQKLFARKPRIIRLMPNGAALMGIDNWRETSEWTAYHQADIARTRLWLEAKEDLPHGRVVDWKSERAIRSDAFNDLKKGAKGMHVADAVITFEDKTIAALEVERNPKDINRLRRILHRLTRAYSLTIYAIPKGETPDEQRKGEAISRAVNTAYDDVKSKSEARPGRIVTAFFPEELS
jgi:hypothetical protein